MAKAKSRSSRQNPHAPGAPPLAGLRVLDLTQVVAGPYCTQMLAYLGADVVKLESPRGDDLRTIVRYRGRDEHEDYFHTTNYSKRSIVLHLKDPPQRKAAQELAKRADVVVENFAPGTAARLGMDWQTLRALNPRLLYCSISGFGQSGPYRDRLALDAIIQAISGVMSVTGEPGGDPLMIGAPLADVIAGMFAAYAVVGALRAVERDGEGCYIDVSMQATLIAALAPRMGETLQAGIAPPALGNQNPIRVPANVYHTKDGGYIKVLVHGDNHWVALCRALERQDWLDEPRFATTRQRVECREEIEQMVSQRLSERTAEEWMACLAAERVPAAPVYDYLQALADPQVAHRGLLHTLQHPVSGAIRVIGPPWIMGGAQAELTPPPVLNQHREEVLREWLGWDAEKIGRLHGRSDAAP